jgi:guanosine-3',5'-bis(diphosphate) 3'-pyrophosphohydrolase
MAWTPDLEEVICLVAEKHSGQKDKAGQPYILHPIRVMLKMQTWEEQYVALLHDILEDTDQTEEDLRKGWWFPDNIVDAVVCLTRSKADEVYMDYVRRCALNPLARRVKIADLEDHLEQNNITGVLEPRHISRYERALEYLEGHGNS